MRLAMKVKIAMQLAGLVIFDVFMHKESILFMLKTGYNIFVSESCLPTPAAKVIDQKHPVQYLT